MTATATAPKLRLLTKASDILAIPDIVREEVATPEWGEGTGVLVQSMTAAQRLAWSQSGRVTKRDEQGKLISIEQDPDWDNTTALVICSVVDTDGNPVFSVRQLEALQGKSSAPIERIAEVARRLSRLTPDDKDEAKAELDPTKRGSDTALLAS